MNGSCQEPQRFTLLLDRKPSDDLATSSVVEFLGPLIIELAVRADVVFAPDVTGWDSGDYDAWVREAMHTFDAAIIVDPRLHSALRRAGWTGPCILNPMGGLAHGAGLTRAYAGQTTTRDRIWCVGQADVTLHEALFDSNSELPTILDLPYPCNTDAYRPLRASSNSNSTARLVYAGRLMADKNVHSLLYVLRELLDRGLECELVLAGSFDDAEIPSRSHYACDFEEYFSELAGYLDLEDHLVLAGRLSAPKLAQLYAGANVYVNPTFAVGDNFGLSRVQAQMVGLPVVTADWAGASSYRSEIQFDVPTFMTRSGPRFSIVSFANTVADVLRAAPTLDSKSLATFAKSFTADTIADRLLSVLDELRSSSFSRVVPAASPLLKSVESVAPVRSDGQIPSLRGVSYQDSILRDLHAFYTTYNLADAFPEVEPVFAGCEVELVPALTLIDEKVISLDPLYRIAGSSRKLETMLKASSRGKALPATIFSNEFRDELTLGFLLPIVPMERQS